MHDIVIRGGTIIDGTGEAAFTGDVAIAGGRIAAVGGKAGSGCLRPRNTRRAGGLCAGVGPRRYLRASEYAWLRSREAGAH